MNNFSVSATVKISLCSQSRRPESIIFLILNNYKSLKYFFLLGKCGINQSRFHSQHESED